MSAPDFAYPAGGWAIPINQEDQCAETLVKRWRHYSFSWLARMDDPIELANSIHGRTGSRGEAALIALAAFHHAKMHDRALSVLESLEKIAARPLAAFVGDARQGRIPSGFVNRLIEGVNPKMVERSEELGRCWQAVEVRNAKRARQLAAGLGLV